MLDRARHLLIAVAVSACVAPAAAPARQPPPEREAPPAPPPTAVAPDAAVPSVEAAEDKVRALGITLYNPRHKDNRRLLPSDGYLAPVAPIAGGYLYSGLLDDHLVIGKRDADWNVVWEIRYEQKGFVAYEGGQVGEDAGGNVLAFVPSYITESTNPVQRVVKLAADGSILWELPLVRDKHANSPQIHFGKLQADGSLYLQGHIYQGKQQKTDRPALQWSATVTPDGKLTDAKVGGAIDWATDEW